jgi:5'-AMP-activated protein kinase, regulatory gamma subunit
VSIHPDDSIFDASHILLANHIHRIPIIDKEESNTMLHVLSHHRILMFLLSNVRGGGRNRLLQRSIEELGIGTFNNVVTILKDTPLIVALSMLAERQISAVPLVDETGVVDGIYSKSDAAVSWATTYEEWGTYTVLRHLRSIQISSHNWRNQSSSLQGR